MTSGMQIAAVALITLLALGQPALGANRRLLADTETTSSVQLFAAFVGGLTKDIHGRFLQQMPGMGGQRGASAARESSGGASGAGEARPLAGTTSMGSGLRSTTGGSSNFGTTTARQPGQAAIDSTTNPGLTGRTGGTSVDSTTSNAAVANTGMRGVTNSAGIVGNGQRAEGSVSADVMPSTTNQGGGVRPGGTNLNMESMPSAGSAMSMRSEP